MTTATATLSLRVGDATGQKRARVSSVSVTATRDGTRRAIGAADLVSGAVLASIARAACEQACRRELAGGRPGIGADDLRAATAQRFADMARALTPHNVRHHVDTLPQDLDPVRVEIVRTPSWPSTDVTAE